VGIFIKRDYFRNKMEIIFILLIILVILLITVFILYLSNKRELIVLKEEYDELSFSHRSTQVKHGKSFEQLFPYMKNYPYEPGNFRFIGSPIDGLSFEDDKIVFVEFKTGKSKLTKKQANIRDMVNSKKIKWKEIRS
jgi:predicted Holliday junction resolvase-like endonuclease